MELDVRETKEILNMETSKRKDSQDISQTFKTKKGGRKFETNEDDL